MYEDSRDDVYINIYIYIYIYIYPPPCWRHDSARSVSGLRSLVSLSLMFFLRKRDPPPPSRPPPTVPLSVAPDARSLPTPSTRQISTAGQTK